MEVSRQCELADTTRPSMGLRIDRVSSRMQHPISRMTSIVDSAYARPPDSVIPVPVRMNNYPRVRQGQ
jgi:hypothetical protein